MEPLSTIRLGISRCLLGHPVRYDGGHKHDPFLTQTLGQYVHYVPVCPEVECGLPVPREAMRLVRTPQGVRLVTQKTGIDHTDRMLAWAAPRLDALEEEGLCGFIFKSKSPSSGMERVKIYGDTGQVVDHGSGIFAGLFMARFPLLPVEEEGRLHDPLLRENFIDRIFCLQRFRESVEKEPSLGALVQFHACHKLQILSHSTEHYRALGRLVAHAKGQPLAEVVRAYRELLLAALRLKATVPKNRNVLQHIMGYFKLDLTHEEKRELEDIIRQYARGILPLIVPVTLLSHYARKYEVRYLLEQTYLNPHPLELKLRNHA
ncbi:MAG TPA: DUF1722 domain-containing protein [Desulfomicrobiaceae bacterium]|jgi:uncharacterized protein YbgA (DUF1722 family)/uncharacterized protein YbbK (DUF523 family)|nr:DUF1722 domain-containing protein [Desulfomicrobiaceae bacterium]